MSRVLVTGANGFVGKSLVSHLHKQGFHVIAAIRSLRTLSPMLSNLPVHFEEIGDLALFDSWNSLLDVNHIEHVIHLAVANSHLSRSKQNFELFDSVNVEASWRLARAAAQARVKQFIYLSTSKIDCYTNIKSADAYTYSKWKAEALIKNLHKTEGLNYVIVRTPLVYGQGAKANFKLLDQLVRTRLPLPFASIKSRRSMTYIGNLISALECLLKRNDFSSRSYTVCDTAWVTPAGLMSALAEAYGYKARLFPCPIWLLRWVGGCIKRRDVVETMLSDCIVGHEEMTKELNWNPPYTVNEALKNTVS